jgi:hypothetical protein
MKTLDKDYTKTEDDMKALQSVGQIIGEVLKQLDHERCKSNGPPKAGWASKRRASRNWVRARENPWRMSSGAGFEQRCSSSRVDGSSREKRVGSSAGIEDRGLDQGEGGVSRILERSGRLGPILERANKQSL